MGILLRMLRQVIPPVVHWGYQICMEMLGILRVLVVAVEELEIIQEVVAPVDPREHTVESVEWEARVQMGQTEPEMVPVEVGQEM